MTGQVVTPPMTVDHDSLLVWAVVSLIGIIATVVIASLGLHHARAANRAVNDVDHGEERIFDRVRRIDEGAVWRNEALTTLLEKVGAMEHEVAENSRHREEFLRHWGALAEQWADAPGLMTWMRLVDERIRALEERHP